MQNLFIRGTVAALLACTSNVAMAQADVQPDQAELGSEDIVVTAQKREQRIQDVPLTVTAVTGARMAELGVNSLTEVAMYIPGLRIQEQSANNPGFVIRGITSDSGSSQQGARVTLYYNGVDISRTRGAYQDLYDLERVEVVKGPQATLFGTASAVGAVSIISARPVAGTSGGITASYGNYNRTQVSGFLNAGNDVLAGRLAFAYKYRDGYVRNIAGDPDRANQNQGRIDQDDLNGQDQRGVRGSLRFTPSDSVTADLVLTYDGQRNPGTAFKSRAFAPTGGQTGDYGDAELSGSPFSEQVLGDRKLGLKRNVYDANLTVAIDVAPGVTFTTVNGYRRFDANEVFDADGGPAWYLEFAEDAKGDQWSHEGRFNFTGDKLRASFGWNAFFENNSQRVPFSTEEGTYIACSVAGAYAPVRAGLTAAGVPTGTGCVAANGTIPAATLATRLLSGGRLTQQAYASEFTNFGNNDTYSVFADATWTPVPALEVTAGARVLIEDRQSGYSSVQPNSVLLAGLGINTSLLGTVSTGGRKLEAERSFSAFLPRFNVLYRVTDRVNIYGTVSKGRRSPVVQLAAASVGGTVVPNLQIIPNEIVWNYEGGIKGSAGPFTGSLGVFYQTYKGFQFSVTQNAVTTTQSADAKNLGVEAEANLRLGQMVSLFGNFAYIDGKLNEDAAFGNFSGDRFRLQPKISASGGINVRVPLNDSVTLYAVPSATYQSKVFFELPNNDAISQGGYTLVNARAGVEFAQGRYRIGGFVRNATNERYLIDAGNTGGGFGVPTYISGEPRMYGVEIGGKF
ncbi:TonB-dependent receptor [Sphingomonas hylomeconis]|uniref:TonB-dependent receptor n=1 Tax=Sphingomonas hylomeconis TaxID=1395958 RepID=A0ABV7STW2_9SPHN|nr:TonB-dependent receptor [Sphingomonas hylomeconis]